MMSGQPLMRFFLGLIIILFSNYIKAACINYQSQRSGNSIEIIVSNTCGQTANINVCVTIDGEPVRAAHRVENNKKWTFDFVDWNGAPYKYEVRGCKPGSSTRADTCPADCQGSSSQKMSASVSGSSSDSSGFLTEGLYAYNYFGYQSCSDPEAALYYLVRVNDNYYQFVAGGSSHSAEDAYDIRRDGNQWYMHGLGFKGEQRAQLVRGSGRSMKVLKIFSYKGDQLLYCEE